MKRGAAIGGLVVLLIAFTVAIFGGIGGTSKSDSPKNDSPKKKSPPKKATDDTPKLSSLGASDKLDFDEKATAKKLAPIAMKKAEAVADQVDKKHSAQHQNRGVGFPNDYCTGPRININRATIQLSTCIKGTNSGLRGRGAIGGYHKAVHVYGGGWFPSNYSAIFLARFNGPSVAAITPPKFCGGTGCSFDATVAPGMYRVLSAWYVNNQWQYWTWSPGPVWVG